jgi:phosphoglycerol transferase
VKSLRNELMLHGGAMNIFLRVSRWRLLAIATLISVSFLLVAFRILSLHPTVMQDELLYSMSARHLPMSEAQIPNYLFYWVYSTTNLCGPSFYACGKALNLVFLAGTSLVIYLIAKTQLSKSVSLVLAIAAFVGPMSVYASFFMPDTMFYFGATVFIWWLLKLNSGSKSAQWLAAGVLLGLTSLVKPHALFMVPAVIAYVVYLAATVDKPKAVWAAGRLGLIGGATALVKFGLGFIFAGVNGLSLFGTSYTNSISTFVSNTASALGGGEAPLVVRAVSSQPAHLTDYLSVDKAQINDQIPGWIFQQLLGHAGGFLLATSVGALFAFCAFMGAIRRRSAPERHDAAVVFLNFAVATCGLIVVAFTVLLTVNGHPHNDRLMFRYYEYLIPLIIVVAFFFAKSPISMGRTTRLVYAGLFSTLILVAASVISKYSVNFFDASTLSGISASAPALWVTVFFALVVAVAWAFELRRVVATGLVLLVAFSAVVGSFLSFKQVESRIKTDYYDNAGVFARDYLDDTELKKLTVVAINDWAMQRTLFALDSPDVDFKIVKSSVLFDTAYLAEGREWVLFVGDIAEATKPTFQIAGNGYILARYSTQREFNFSQEVGSGLINTAAGLGRPQSWGAWTYSPSTTLTFDKPLGPKATLRLTMSASLANAGKSATIDLCGSRVQFQVGTEPTTAKFDFDNAKPCGSVAITNPSPTPIGQTGPGFDNRLVGFKLYLIDIPNAP